MYKRAIDQASSVAKIFFRMYMDQDAVKVHKHTNIQPSWTNKFGQ